MRLVLFLGSLVVSIALTATPAMAADRVVERGIVQSITADQVVLRALDGSERVLALGPETRVLLNGVRVRVGAVRPGHVAEVVTVGLGPARVVRAFGRAVAAVERGVLVSVGSGTVVVQRADGGAVTVELTARTTVRVGGIVVRRRLLRPGMRVDVTRALDGTARAIVIRRMAVR